MGFAADEFTGRTLGKYQLLCRVAVGGMAEIFLGFAKSGPTAYKPVVLKRILQEQREDENSLQMLIDEAKVTATLSHPNVAQVLDLEKAGEDVLLVIEFIRGATLEEIAQVYTDRKEQVPMGFVLAAIRDCALGINHAHSHRDAKGNPQPIIHRDVTPKNLMVDFEGVGRVLDFGIARAAGAARRTVAGMVRGTSAYMSPEQAIDSKIDTRTDIFSLGVIFHELLVGQRLFYKGNAAKEMAAVYEQEIPLPSAVNRRVPKALDQVVMKALERPMGKRYQTGIDLVRELQLAAGTTIWAPDRCAELVRTRFSTRRQEINALITKMSEEEGPSLSTAPGRPGFSHVEPSTVIMSKPAERPTGDTDESASPTKFFKPEFAESGALQRIAPRDKTLRLADGGVQAEIPDDLPSRSVEVRASYQRLDQVRAREELPPRADSRASHGRISHTVRNEGPVPDSVGELAPPTGTNSGVGNTTAPGVGSVSYQSEVATDPSRAAIPASLRETIERDVVRRPRPQGASKLAIIAAAVGALVVGGAAGAVLYRTLAKTPSDATGVGRVTIGSDRPADVMLGQQVLGPTPLVDLWLPTGVHAFSLREHDGSTRALQLEVKKDQVTKVSVKLDTLPKVP